VSASKPTSRRATTRTAPQLVASEEILGRVQQTLDVLARRAYEIFESKGRPAGRDLEDWLRAEMELLHPARIEISGTPRGLSVRAEVAGFRPSELHVCVEPRRVTIVGERRPAEKRAAGKAIYVERRSERILRFVDLPIAVDAARATAVLKAGVCEITLPRAAPTA
jgi:HSP20 family molecular chaperone IbpA